MSQAFNSEKRLYYAVAKGRTPGIYATWVEAKLQVANFKGAKYKKFENERDANNFMGQNVMISKPVQVSLKAFFKQEDPQETENTLIVFTDGSAINNGSKNCQAGFATVWPYHKEMNFAAYLQNGTNNQNIRSQFHIID